MSQDSAGVLITGASKGIGQSTATRLTEKGWRVFAGVREPAGASEVAEAIEKALTASSPDDRYLVGRGARAVTLLEPLLPSAVFDRVKKRVAAS